MPESIQMWDLLKAVIEELKTSNVALQCVFEEQKALNASLRELVELTKAKQKKQPNQEKQRG